VQNIGEKNSLAADLCSTLAVTKRQLVALLTSRRPVASYP